MLPRTRTDAPTLSQKMVLFPLEFSLTHARAFSLVCLSVCVCLRSVHACVFFFCGFAVATTAKARFRIPTPLGGERISRLPEEENKRNSFRASERASEDGSPSYLLKLMTTTTTSWLLPLCVCIFLPRNLIEWTGDGTSQPARRRERRRRRNRWSFVALGEQPPERWSTKRMLDGGA